MVSSPGHAELWRCAGNRWYIPYDRPIETFVDPSVEFGLNRASKNPARSDEDEDLSPAGTKASLRVEEKPQSRCKSYRFDSFRSNRSASHSFSLR